MNFLLLEFLSRKGVNFFNEMSVVFLHILQHQYSILGKSFPVWPFEESTKLANRFLMNHSDMQN